MSPGAASGSKVTFGVGSGGCQVATLTLGRGQEAGRGCWAVPGRLAQLRAAGMVREAPRLLQAPPSKVQNV